MLYFNPSDPLCTVVYKLMFIHISVGSLFKINLRINLFMFHESFKELESRITVIKITISYLTLGWKVIAGFELISCVVLFFAQMMRHA